ncbi:MAG: type II secretion system GspH family protein [Oscillospiraceae bacterium]|nr:type II secretion system GspH family protein [Oscillospiraceae bacterium]
MKNSKIHGFTLVELIVVIAIIGVLATLIIPSITGYVRKSKQTSANENARTIYQELQSHAVDLELAGNPSTDNDIALSEKVGVTGDKGDCVDIAEWSASVPLKIDIEGYIDVYYEAGYPVSVAWSQSKDNGAIIGRYPNGFNIDQNKTWKNWDDDVK